MNRIKVKVTNSDNKTKAVLNLILDDIEIKMTNLVYNAKIDKLIEPNKDLRFGDKVFYTKMYTLNDTLKEVIKDKIKKNLGEEKFEFEIILDNYQVSNKIKKIKGKYSSATLKATLHSEQNKFIIIFKGIMIKDDKLIFPTKHFVDKDTNEKVYYNLFFTPSKETYDSLKEYLL